MKLGTVINGNSLISKRNKKRRFKVLVFKLYVGNIDLLGSARVFGYTVYRGFLNRVYGILQLKYGYSVYHFL